MDKEKYIEKLSKKQYNAWYNGKHGFKIYTLITLLSGLFSLLSFAVYPPMGVIFTVFATLGLTNVYLDYFGLGFQKLHNKNFKQLTEAIEALKNDEIEQVLDNKYIIDWLKLNDEKIVEGNYNLDEYFEQRADGANIKPDVEQSERVTESLVSKINKKETKKLESKKYEETKFKERQNDIEMDKGL